VADPNPSLALLARTVLLIRWLFRGLHAHQNAKRC
jgi:hypothetical protein